MLWRDSVLLALGAGVGAAVALRRPALPRRRVITALAGDGAFEEYNPPTLPEYASPPTRRLRLAHLPTPLHRWPMPRIPESTELWVKREVASN